MTNYGKDYPSYGKIKAKLVMKRPEEKYYPFNFAGIPQSKYSLENKKTEKLINEQNKELVEKFFQE